MVQVAAFAETGQYPLVVKPIESAGADGFKLCDSMDEAGQKPQQWLSNDSVFRLETSNKINDTDVGGSAK